MKWRRGLLLALLLVALGGGLGLSAAETIVVDVVDGELRVQSYRVTLAAAERPVIIDTEEGQLVLRALTPKGEVTLRLGEGGLSVTERALPYVTVARTGEEPTSPPAKGAAPPRGCRHCGALEAEHRCPRCGTAWCIHDDIQCGYRLNPAPTQFFTHDPEGERLTWYVAEDGSLYEGTPPMEKYKVWSPAKTYMALRATPTPHPHGYITPSPSPSPFPW